MDSKTGKIYYYNRKTQKSESERPKNFDGVDISKKVDNEYTRTFQTFEATPLVEEEQRPQGKIGVGKVGQWEEVAPEESFFAQNKVQPEEEKIPGKDWHNSVDNIPEGEI